MKIIIIILSVFMLSGCKPKIIETDVIPFNIDTTIDVYDNIYLYDLLNNIDGIEIISDNYRIDTDVIGKKEYEIVYKLDKKIYSYKYEIDVIDNTYPIVFSGTNRTVLKGYDKDICNLITYGDNYTGNLKCEIVGNYDVNKLGTYNLIYNISDSSNNVTSVNVTLNVVDKINSSTYHNNLTTPISEMLELYKDDDNEIGIDVSEWQGDIDFNKVMDAGVTFVIMRIGVQTDNGEPKLDGKYLDNIKNAKEAGLKVGVYLYSITDNIEDAKKQALWVIDKLNGESLELGVAFDWENWKYWNEYKISFHDINEIANTFMDTIESNGYKAMLYGSKFYLEKIWETSYPIWLAHYIDDKTDYNGDYIIWQQCSNGLIDGINGFVDMNIMKKC